jgi:hypothetical protein
MLVALHDRHLSPTAALIQRTNEVRLAATLSWSKRAKMLGDLLRDFDPNWVSWQLVPYGFHPKGIIPAGCFQLIDAARPWASHVMLHELWIGLSSSDRLSPRIIGALQRRRLLQFLRQLKPACIHTSNSAYQLALAQQQWPSELLPLFGNMPVLPVKTYVARAELTDLLGGSAQAESLCLGVIFGTIHPQWQPEPTLEWLEACARHLGRPVGLLALGRVGSHGNELLARLSSEQNTISIFSAGPQTPEKISHLLQAADFGIATHPWALIGKSGSAATLLEHGLPVIVPRDDWHLRHGSIDSQPDPLLHRMSDVAPVDFPQWLTRRRAPVCVLPTVAHNFISHLSSPAPRGALVA